jgi:zinc protease
MLHRRLVSLPLAALLLSACFTRAAIPDAGLAIGPRAADARLDVEVNQTANGLRFALVPDSRTNLVTIDVRYTVGAADDPAGRTGLAHLVEHLSYTGSAFKGGPSLSQRLDQLALGYNAYTNWDETHYTATALAGNLDAVLGLEAERMGSKCKHISADMLARERQVVLNESRERGQDVWSAVTAQLFGPDHPYTHAIGGSDVAKVTRDDVCAFLDAHYAPSRAILVVVGPIDLARTRDLIHRQFGAMPNGTPGAQRALAAVATTGESVHSADIEEPTALIAFPSPPWGRTGNEARDLVIDLWIRRAQSLGQDAGVTGIRRGYLGGYRGGIDVIQVRAEHWSKLPSAVEAVFRARDELLADDFTLGRRETRSSHVNSHLASIEQLSGMGIRVADYMQYADHPWFMVQGFNEAENLWPEGLTIKFRQVDGYYGQRLVDYAEDAPQLRVAIGQLPTRAGVHVAWIRPDHTAPEMAASPPDVPRVEVAEWKPEIDAKEADRALPTPAATPKPQLQRFTLPNGMQVVMAPVPRAPTVDIRVVFPAGTLNDPATRPGTAMLSAYLLDHEVPKDLTDAEFTRAYWALGLGTRMTADLDVDTTVFRAAGAARYGDWHLWRLFWMLDQGGYDATALARVRSEMTDSDKPILGNELARALVGPGQVKDPKPAWTRTITVQDLEDFRARHYRPRGATLIITGGFDPEGMATAISRLWATWRDSKAPPVPYRKITPAPSRQHHLAIDDAKARQLTVALAFPASTTDVATRLVVQDMVASQVRSVRARLGVTYGIAASYEVLADVAPTMLVSGEVDPERGGEAITALLASLDELRSDKAAFTRAFVAARRRVLGRVMARVADTPALASELEALARSGWSRNDLDAVIRDIAALKPASASEAIGRDLASGKMVVALSGRRTVIEKAYRDAKMPAPLFIPAPAAVAGHRAATVPSAHSSTRR